MGDRRRELEAALRELGGTIVPGLPRRAGFALLLFDFGAGGYMTWLSNARRADMVRALRELIARLESPDGGATQGDA